METTIVTSKQVRQRLGTYLQDLKYKPEDIILVSKPGADDYVCVLANPQMLRDEGVDIPAFEKSESKPEPKKKK
jgi:hypothetical protein